MPDAILPVPFTLEQIEELSREYPTPFYVYDGVGIRETARKFRDAFSWVPEVGEEGFRNFFAVKALPNPYILDILRREGMGADCSSMAELHLANATGLSGERIMFTSNDTPLEEFIEANDLGAVINFDDASHVDFFERGVGNFPDLVSFRINPGPVRDAASFIFGKPQDQKYGIPTEKVVDAYSLARDRGATRFGMHTMIASNAIEADYLIETSRMLFDQVQRVNEELGIKFEFVNLGGGVGIPYSPGEESFDMERFSSGVKQHYKEMIEGQGLGPMRVVMECGRAITGPHGWLVSRVEHVTQKYLTFVGLDACMANLMRPGMYDAYHGITFLGKEGEPHDHTYNVTGSLCENNDQFARGREFPGVKRGDIAAIENAGAHGHSMGFNYNGKLRSAEFLFNRDEGSFRMIRRGESLGDYFATLDFDDGVYSNLESLE